MHLSGPLLLFSSLLPPNLGSYKTLSLRNAYLLCTCTMLSDPLLVVNDRHSWGM